ncbi:MULTISPECIES: hypothetical protein [Bradyrhizobium]|uniref:hypothetical protein n=1 Tax=Bradyrhizobium elkanii TaxID=29448 RepID=UPI0006891744|nr:hypothetical protein [Bradyrhizobium elkanii]
MPIKMSGFGDVAREFDDAAKAIAALDGDLAEVRFDPADPSSVESAIANVEAAIDRKLGAYRGNTIVETWVAEIKKKYREELIERAATARMETPTEQDMGDEAAIYRRLNNAAFDLIAADFQTYGETIKKLARLLRNPEIEPITQQLTQGIDLEAWLKAANDTQGSWVGSAKLSWPADHEKELGTVILLIEKMAKDDDMPSNISHQFYYNGNNITSNLANMTRQLIVPFVRDYIAYLKDRQPAPMKMALPEPTRAVPVQAHPIHTVVVWTTFIIGLVLLALGGFAVWHGSTSDTEINILGSSFKSGSIGAVAIFLGALLIVLIFRRLLTSVERLK